MQFAGIGVVNTCDGMLGSPFVTPAYDGNESSLSAWLNVTGSLLFGATDESEEHALIKAPSTTICRQRVVFMDISLI